MKLTLAAILLTLVSFVFVLKTDGNGTRWDAVVFVPLALGAVIVLLKIANGVTWTKEDD